MPKNKTAENVKTGKSNWSLSSNYEIQTLLSWVFADIAYTLLPIAVIMFIQLSTRGATDFLYLSPEWSFATIVSYGLAITNLIELKTEVQHDSSHKIYTGTRFHIILLIISVIVLSLVSLRDEGININTRLLWPAQIGLFIHSISSLYIYHSFKRQAVNQKKYLPVNIIGRKAYYSYLYDSLTTISEELKYIRFALSKDGNIPFRAGKEHLSNAEIHKLESERKGKVKLLSNSVQQLFNETIQLLSDFSESTKLPKKTGE